MGCNQSREVAVLLRENRDLLKQNNEVLARVDAGLQHRRALVDAGGDEEADVRSEHTNHDVVAPLPGPVPRAHVGGAASLAPPNRLLRATSQVVKDVFISLHVDSTKELAMKVREVLHNNGITTWCCLDIGGGANFRQEIVQNASSCRVFLPLINAAWCQSGECEWEFNLVQRLNIKRRSPLLLPLFLDKNLDQDEHWIVLALLTNKQSLFLEENDLDATWQSLASCLKGLLADSPVQAGAKVHREDISPFDGYYQGYLFPTNKREDKDKDNRILFEQHLHFILEEDEDQYQVRGWGHDPSGTFELSGRMDAKADAQGEHQVELHKDYKGRHLISDSMKLKSSSEGVKEFKGKVEMNLKMRPRPVPVMSGLWNLPPPSERFRGFITMQKDS